MSFTVSHPIFGLKYRNHQFRSLGGNSNESQCISLSFLSFPPFLSPLSFPPFPFPLSFPVFSLFYLPFIFFVFSPSFVPMEKIYQLLNFHNFNINFQPIIGLPVHSPRRTNISMEMVAKTLFFPLLLTSSSNSIYFPSDSVK